MQRTASPPTVTKITEGRLALVSDGTALALWTSSRGIWAAVRTVGSAWREPERLAQDSCDAESGLPQRRVSGDLNCATTSG